MRKKVTKRVFLPYLGSISEKATFSYFFRSRTRFWESPDFKIKSGFCLENSWHNSDFVLKNREKKVFYYNIFTKNTQGSLRLCGEQAFASVTNNRNCRKFLSYCPGQRIRRQFWWYIFSTCSGFEPPPLMPSLSWRAMLPLSYCSPVY